MKDYSFSIPQEVIVGKGTLSKLPDTAGRLGMKHSFIISGPHLKKIGTVDKCSRLLEKAGIKADSFCETEGNPSVETVTRAVLAFKKSGADSIIAFGGGSPMDVAKAVGIVAKYGGSITDYEGGGKVPGDIIPLIAIPTTAGTGSEVTAFSVITDHSRKYKLTVFSYKLIPRAAILDADLIASVPAQISSACGIDAFIHAFESYISKAASPFSEAMSEKAMELIGKYIRRYVSDRSDLEAAEGMLSGSLFAGIAFSWARLGNIHAMSHPVSAFWNVPHGVANGILLPIVTEFNEAEDKGKYFRVYNYISEKKIAEDSFRAPMLTEALKKLNHEIGIPEKLSDAGVTEEYFDKMADDAMKSGNIAVNPRKTVKEDILTLYRRAL